MCLSHYHGSQCWWNLLTRLTKVIFRTKTDIYIYILKVWRWLFRSSWMSVFQDLHARSAHGLGCKHESTRFQAKDTIPIGPYAKWKIIITVVVRKNDFIGFYNECSHGEKYGSASLKGLQMTFKSSIRNLRLRRKILFKSWEWKCFKSKPKRGIRVNPRSKSLTWGTAVVSL